MSKHKLISVHFLWSLYALILSYNVASSKNHSRQAGVNNSREIKHRSPAGSLYNVNSLEDGSLNLMSNSSSPTIPKAVHKNAIKEARRLLQSGRCKHVYLDMGTNVGIQIRKFFQPLSYPQSIIWPPIWDKYFGKYDVKTNNRTDVCVFGFEPNPKHNEILRRTEKYYQNNGFSVIIFKETAISTTHGNATFIHDFTSDAVHQEWGGSIINRGQGNSSQIKKLSYDVFTLDISKFISIEIALRKGQLSNSKIVAKMDIEGAEYSVLPNMLAHGSLCSISYIGIEWHPNYLVMKNPDFSMKVVFDFVHKHVKKVVEFFGLSTPYPDLPAKVLSHVKAKGCQTIIQKQDDEIYGGLGEDIVPMDLNTKMKLERNQTISI